jgi:prepilin-type processing-associated H-X9-DG protein/prepilin-type N-terminal cleavage/methylation domain-containing protein
MEAVHDRDSRWEPHRCGLTVVEVLVAIAVLGLLAAIVVPAISSARESMRRTECSSHLHQLGIALASCQQTDGFFPTVRFPRGEFPNPLPPGKTSVVPHHPLLPHLGYRALYDDLVAPVEERRLPDPLPFLDVFVCPSDGIPEGLQNGATNYYYNSGSKFGASNGFRRSDGVRTHPRDIPDGLSHTAALSEHLAGQWPPQWPEPDTPPSEIQRQTGRYVWFLPQTLSQPGEEDLAADLCRSDAIPPTREIPGISSSVWRAGGYRHIITPNERGCAHTPKPVINQIYIIPPTSMHNGGVNVLMADGRVAFTSDAIARSVWRAIGSRNGAEAHP